MVDKKEKESFLPGLIPLKISHLKRFDCKSILGEGHFYEK
jgi:hypothetical protein